MDWRDRFWELVGDYRRYLWLLLMFLLFLLVLTAVSFLFGEPGTASYTMAKLNLVLIAVLGTVVAVMFWYSSKRQSRY